MTDSPNHVDFIRGDIAKVDAFLFELRKEHPALFSKLYVDNLGRFLSVADENDFLIFVKRLVRNWMPPDNHAATLSSAELDRAQTKADQIVALKIRLNARERPNYKDELVYLNVETPREVKHAREFSCKEVETVKWIENFSQGDILYDVGANIGLFTLLCLAQTGKEHVVVAFEPAFSSFHSLCKSLEINSFNNRAVPIQAGLSDKTGIDQFNYWSTEPGTAKSVVGDAVDWKGDRFKPVTVQKLLTFKLDDAIRIFGLPHPNHIKIDVDGIEMKVLSGATKCLGDTRLRSIMVEANGLAMERELIALLGKFGFSLSQQQAKNIRGENEMKTRNNFFCRTTESA